MFDYEVDLLIDYNGVMWVLECGWVVVFMRNYFYFVLGLVEYKVLEFKIFVWLKFFEGICKFGRRFWFDFVFKFLLFFSSVIIFLLVVNRVFKVGLDKKGFGVGFWMDEDRLKVVNLCYEEYE